MSWVRVANLGLILCSLAVVLTNTLMQPFQETARSLGTSIIVLGESATITIAFILAVYFLWSYEWGNRLLSHSLITIALALQMILALLYTRELISSTYGAASFFNVGWIASFALQQWAAEEQVSVSHRDAEATAALAQTQGWVEALIPSFLVLCMALSAASVADEITAQTVRLACIAIGAFAALLALRESWLYSHGQRLRGQLELARDAVVRARSQLAEIDAHRAELERTVELTARAGGIGLWDWDLRTNYLQFSPEWRRQLGYAENEVANDYQEFAKRLHPDDEERVNTAVANYLKEPQGEFSLEMRMQHRDGSYRWILTQGHLLLGDDGKPARFRGAHVDITAFKQLEQSLRDSEARYKDLADALEQRVSRRTAELTEAYRESQNFSYAVAHDLKAPLRAMNGFSALLEQSAAVRLTEDERGFLDRVKQGALQMASLIDGLLAYSRMEHREQRLGEVDCREIVAETVQSLEEAIRRDGAQIVIDVEAVAIVADREGLRVVLRNLIENALKFSRSRHPPQIELTGTREQDRWVLSVRDNGIGFDPTYREKIFEIFNRLNATGYEGTGIGLALVRKAVQRMRGQVWAESVLGEGSTFYVALPLAALPVSSASDDAADSLDTG